MPYEFNHVHLKAPDPKKTADWYINAFNFKIIGDMVRPVGDRFIRCQTADGKAITISGARSGEHLEPGNASAHWGIEHVAIAVNDMTAAVARLVGLGATLLEGPLHPEGEPVIAYIKAPDDTRIELGQGQTPQPVDNRFIHVHLKSSDPEHTVAWYTRAFNFKVVRDYTRSLGDRFFVCTTADGVMVNISGARPGERLDAGNANAHWGLEHFGISVPEIVAEIKRLTDMGAKLLEGPNGNPGELRIAFIKAPDDTRIELMQLPPAR